ncbi:uncharacterized protein Polr2M [Lepeophtheirus salmonis]|uniref:uncharacterized protein Polr2M n=1 Tax=Lepeophtheirus salmonis TaxID=72036 RepID=UPI001AE44C59|nr:uncharacterized protein LOC121119582 [Lepeophtheirus salmonis]
MVLGELSSDKNILSDEYKVISRVPGTVAPIGQFQHEKKNKITEKSLLREMLETLERENRILSHPKLLKSLPDGGEKIKIRIRSLKELIDQKKKKDEEEATKLMSELTISKVDVDALEWNSGISAPTFEDFDDEELESKNPFKILTEREVPQKMNKSSSFDPHTEQLSSKIDQIKPPSRFLPFSAINHSDQNIKKATSSLIPTSNPSKIRKPSELMPLPAEIKHSSVTPISLSESLRIQVQKDKELKELQIKRAAQKLMEFQLENTSNNSLEISNRMNYRDKKEEHDSDDSLNESDDEFATPEGQSEDES